MKVVNVIVTIEKNVYDKLKEDAKGEGISVGAVIREILLNYFELEDETKSYAKKGVSNEIIIVGEKEYVRIQVRLSRENELVIKNELKQKKMTINQLLKNEILLTT